MREHFGVSDAKAGHILKALQALNVVGPHKGRGQYPVYLRPDELEIYLAEDASETVKASDPIPVDPNEIEQKLAALERRIQETDL